MVKNNTPWYIAGLHFQCQQCSQCCSGPGEGYIWVTKPEIKFIAEALDITIAQLRKKYLRRYGLRTSIIEHPDTKDCIFLKKIDGWKKCIIYDVRPNQCRIWPFWASNLAGPNAWNSTAQKCPGINRGKLVSFEEIQRIKKQKKWWKDDS